MAHKKPNLPTKTCAHCGRPFAWRKKWARDWENVRYCSEACREARFTPAAPSTPSPRKTAARSRH